MEITGNILPDPTETGVLPAVQAAGGGLCMVDGTLEWTGGTVWGNTAQLGGGIALYAGTVTMDQVAIAANTASYGGAMWIGSPTLDASQVRSWCNTATSEGGSFYLALWNSDALFTYLDLALNSSPVGAEVSGVDGSLASLEGAAASGNSANALFDTAGVFRVDTSAVANAGGEVFGSGTVSGSSVVLSDPLFSSVTCNDVVTDDDFTLQATSPAIDAGPSADLDVDGSRADAGANGGPGGAW